MEHGASGCEVVVDRSENIRERSESAVRTIVEDILSDLDSGRLIPGSRLPNEQSYCHRYGVSRYTVRKALDALEARGVLVRQVGRGTYVTEGVNRGSATPGIRPADPDGETSWGLADLTEARMLLEPELMSLVVERATAEDLDRIEQMLEDIALAETWSDFKERKYAFHLEMVKATKNEFLIDVFGSIVVARRQAWRQHAADKHPNVKVGKGLVLREGRMILKALRGRNAERAKAAVRLSLMRVLVSISEF